MKIEIVNSNFGFEDKWFDTLKEFKPQEFEATPENRGYAPEELWQKHKIVKEFKEGCVIGWPLENGNSCLICIQKGNTASGWQNIQAAYFKLSGISEVSEEAMKSAFEQMLNDKEYIGTLTENRYQEMMDFWKRTNKELLDEGAYKSKLNYTLEKFIEFAKTKAAEIETVVKLFEKG